jgi:arylsulfatase
MEHTTPVTFPEDETFDIGEDTRTGVAMLRYRYDVPFTFTGKIDKLNFKLVPFTPQPEVATEPKPELPPMAAPDPVDAPDSN